MAVMSLPSGEFPRTYPGTGKRLPGMGGIAKNNGGFHWQIMRKRVTYRGPTVAKRADAEAGLEEALAALDRGETPAVATPRAPDRVRSRTLDIFAMRSQLQATEPVAYPSGDKRPQERADCLPCPTCQDWRDNQTGDELERLACGHGRGERVAHSRPCLFVGCTASNYLDENPVSGSVKFNHPTKEPGDIRADSCSLDVADDGPATLDRAGAAAGVTRERARQVEESALVKIRRSGDASLSMPAEREEYARPRAACAGCP